MLNNIHKVEMLEAAHNECAIAIRDIKMYSSLGIKAAKQHAVKQYLSAFENLLHISGGDTMVGSVEIIQQGATPQG